MTKIQALLFDVDGTLVDTEELHRQSFNQVFLELRLGWDWSVGLYAQLLSVSGGADRIARYIDLIDMVPAEKTRLRRVIPQVHRLKTQTYRKLITSNMVRPRPGVLRLIEEAKLAGLLVGLAATSASENVQELLAGALGFQANSAIDAIVFADQVARKKPAPDMYELLITMLRAPVSGCVAFEDSENGVASAKAAGLYTVATPTRWTAAQRLDEADLILPSLGDLDRPLDPADAARLGAPYLALAQLEALCSAAAPSPRLRDTGS